MLNNHLELGDRVELALKLVGVDKELMKKVLGKDCKCGERQERLNQLERWAKRVMSGRLEKAKEYLERMQ